MCLSARWMNELFLSFIGNFPDWRQKELEVEVGERERELISDGVLCLVRVKLGKGVIEFQSAPYTRYFVESKWKESYGIAHVLSIDGC